MKISKWPSAGIIFCFYVITLCFTFFGYIVVMSYNTRYSLPQEAGMIMAAVISIATGVCGYVIGSNSQSKSKDELISKAMDSVPVSSIINNSPINVSTLTLTWLGSFDTAPGNPTINDAYIDTIQGKKFYWDGKNWNITTQSPA